MARPAPRPGHLPPPAVSDIPARQNDPALLKLLRAKSAAYDWTQRLYTIQFFTLVVLPLILAIWQRLSPGISWLTGAVGFLLVVADWKLVEPTQKRWKGFGAAFQEQFDCALFGTPWRGDRNGSPPSAELIHRWSGRHPSTNGLKDWYSPVVGGLPPLAATIVCQRTNGLWNGTMRERYAVCIQALVVTLIIALLAVTLGVGVTARTVFAAVGLALPLFRWVFKEMTQQKEAGAASQKVVERAEKLWRRLLDGGARERPAIEQEIRELQNDIFDQRRLDHQVFSWVYSWWRESDEQTMHAGAEALVSEYLRTRSP